MSGSPGVLHPLCQQSSPLQELHSGAYPGGGQALLSASLASTEYRGAKVSALLFVLAAALAPNILCRRVAHSGEIEIHG